jgi:O-methyltransferase involved in polyketide biosynthesis
MATTLPAFTPLEDSLFLTLYARALDNRRPHPILGDAIADQLVHKLDYYYGQLDIDTNLILNVALRAKKLDDVARSFIARHPDAVGLDLGAGLDTRFERVAPPSTVDWYDIDFPTVAATRERVLPDRPNAHVIGADVTDPNWLDAVPSGRPAVIVADGMMAFLTQDELVSLWNRLISHFPSGEMSSTATPASPSGSPSTPAAPSPWPTRSSSPAWTTPVHPKAGTPSCSWSGRSCSAGNPRWPSSHRSGAGTTGWPPAAPPGRGREPSSCTTASKDPRGRGRQDYNAFSPQP